MTQKLRKLLQLDSDKDEKELEKNYATMRPQKVSKKDGIKELVHKRAVA